MLSPFRFYCYYLKDKTAEQILDVIKSLKRGINSDIEKKEATIDADPRPYDYTYLAVERMYLATAFYALEDAGGTYTLSNEELGYLSYMLDILYINKIKFTSGGYFGGYKTTIFTFVCDKVYVKTMDAYAEEDLKILGEESTITKQKILEGIEDLHIFEWRSSYNSDTLDGTQWNLEISFSSNNKVFKSSGSNAYPYNYHDFLVLLGLAR